MKENGLLKSAFRNMVIIRVARRIGHSYSDLRKERFFKILGITCIIILYGALALFISERYYMTKGAGGIFDAVYWAVVTIATVGYGDIVPTSTAGKVFALMIILSGPALLSLLTASIAFVFVERKFRLFYLSFRLFSANYPNLSEREVNFYYFFR